MADTTREATVDLAVLAAQVRAEKATCPFLFHNLYPKPSCWYCCRNGAFERAARIVEATSG